MRGFRVFADVLLDVSEYTRPPDVTPHEWQRLAPQDRAGVILLDHLKAAGFDLCGTFHVSKLRRQVNPQTGEIRWMI